MDSRIQVISNSFVLFSNYSGGVAGGIYNEGSTLTINNSTLFETRGAFSSIFNGKESILIINNSTLTRGGGIDNKGTMTLADSTISKNHGAWTGGISNSGTLSVSNSVISNDGGDDGTGSIYNTGTATITDSTVSDSRVHGHGSGGGIRNPGAMIIDNRHMDRNYNAPFRVMRTI